jgi:lipid-A-disaccharide synthase
MLGIGGRLSQDGRSIEIEGQPFSVERSIDYEAIARAALVVTIPGTKCIEAAVLGRPMLVAVPLNRADEIAVNGLAAYLHLVPLIGRPLKSWVVRKVERRFRFVTQPNIDANRMIVPEMRGILRPADVAAKAAAMLNRPAELRAMGEVLVQIYASHVGASHRMAAEALAVAREEAAPVRVAL